MVFLRRWLEAGSPGIATCDLYDSKVCACHAVDTSLLLPA